MDARGAGAGLIDLSKVVTLDFETYYDSKYSLRSKEYNTSEYIRDPQFKAHCVGIKIGDGETQVYWEEDIAPALQSIDWETHSLLCHHTNFDGLILSHHYGVVPSFYLDTLSMARALHNNQIREGNGLDAVAGFYGVGNKLPNVLGKMKGHREIPVDLRPEASEYTKMDVDLTHVIFQAMQQVYPVAELRQIDLTCRMFCDPIFGVDLKRVEQELARELADKRAKVLACGDALAPDRDPAEEWTDDEISDVLATLQSSGKLAAALTSLGVEPPMKISPRTGQTTYAFSLQDEDFIALGSHPDSRVRALIGARLAVKSTLGETRAKRFLKAGENEWRLPVYLNYCGAHTTRWSGGNKLNLQNLPRGGELRRAILAPPGHAIVVCDSAQIEARVNAWLAGQEDLLAAFRTGADIYSAFASEIYGFNVDKKNNPDERFLGKVCILGLGYGMGWKKFMGVLALGMMGPPLEISAEESRRIVNLYRSKYPFIKALWRRMDDVLYRMFMKRLNGKRDDYSVFAPGVLEFDEQSVWLPNGLGLHYPELTGEYDPERDIITNYTYKAGREYSKIYGALLVENVVQALARTIVASQMLEISDKWRIGTMTHDEVVAVAPLAKAEECLDDMMRIMKTPPAWAPDLPLSAEGGFDTMYSK